MTAPARPDDDLLDGLTPAQREAVTHFDGPMLVVAGPGSGKTRVITRRIAWLLGQGVRPWNVLAITFTNKAAGEMRSRVDALVPGNRVWVSTFHALGARLLRQYAERAGLDRNFTVYDVGDRDKIVKDALEAAGLDNVRFTPERIAGAISKAKNQLLGPPEYAKKAQDYFGQAVAHVYPLYEQRMRAVNALDFDDLLYWPALMLRHDDELREELDARFRYLLVDEYQDTNSPQYQIARLLSVNYPNICVVGDPDQSIYKWRGSDIRNILDFERDFPETRVVNLDQNFRSTRGILKAADSLIAHNRQRKPRILSTDNDEGQPVRALTFDTGSDESDLVAERIKAEVKAGRRRYSDYAIFFRINALSRVLESAFLKHSVPYQIVRGLAFYERKEIRDVMAYLRLVVNPRDDLSFLRVVNEPRRGVGDTSLKKLRAYAAPREMSLLAAAAEVHKVTDVRGKAATGLREFAQTISDLRDHMEEKPADLLRRILDRSGTRAAFADSRDEEDQSRLANIEELITAASQFQAEDDSRTATDFLESAALTGDQDGLNSKADTVAVMTLHAAKGLEFPVVYMLAVEQKLLPHERSLQQQDELEEERRLCFVGMTRAREELNICHARLREFRGQALYTVPSMFLEELGDGVERVDLCETTSRNAALRAWRSGEPVSAAATAVVAPASAMFDTARPKPGPVTGAPLPPDERGFAVGVTVEHDQFGKGKVVEATGSGVRRRLRVLFAAAGEKVFMASYAPLKVVG